jgi:4-diphosphocytidyl-2-C-methyl-D-erythritol kinase
MQDAPTAALARWRAPAKINPFLAVLGRRADGYHELVTTLLALDWCDQLDVRVSDTAGARLALRGPAASTDIPTDERNLVLRAVRVLRETTGTAVSERGLELALEKHLPSQGGLGGGSSDAAAALAASAVALGIELSAAARADLLARLGSDCAFFGLAATGYALCRGRGEQVEPLPPPRPGWWIALLVPDVGSPTAAVYAELATSLRAPLPVPSFPAEIFDLEESAARQRLRNDLEPAALRAVPALARVRACLDARDARHWQLSGSGASYYGIYRDPERAADDLRELELALRSDGCALRAARLCVPLGRGVHRVD